MATNAELRPYGFRPGKSPSWCAACNREFRGGVRGFKCHLCATTQRNEVERECEAAGMNE
jgi:hypothetical protein